MLKGAQLRPLAAEVKLRYVAFAPVEAHARASRLYSASAKLPLEGRASKNDVFPSVDAPPTSQGPDIVAVVTFTEEKGDRQ